MVFSSAVFLFIFLPVVFVLSRVLPGIRAKNILLLIASLLFYAFGEPVYILLMLASILVNFTAGRLLPLCGKGLDKLVLALAVVLNLGMLSLFKYTDFFLTTVNQVFSLEIPLTGIALPVGISFFTFQGLSYVIDVYRDREMCAKSIVKLALYISLFPQLIAGPIVIYHDVANQIDHRETTPELTADGIRRFVLGLGKKLLLANTAGRMADLVFTATAQQLDIRVAWLGALCYCLQIYFDFSGYSDMAIGLGRMFGFQFLENFNYPYVSSSIKEFWRRWHISLSSWFRDYLYIPLGGNRKGKLRTEVNKGIVFFCTGLWHGASWNFVLWGLWHGVFIILEDLLPKGGKVRRAIGHVTTPLIVLLGFVLFRADTLGDAGRIFSQMFTGVDFTLQSDALLRTLLSPLNILTVVLGTAFSLPLLPKVKAYAQGEGKAAAALRAGSYLACGGLFLLCVMNLAGSAFNPFIYFRF
ncbi:MAG TPA: MBOAT family protein [Candidatus Acutalibacter stercorigallinarum]|nr:MBOAT family protein [Candidatus Acutalibacter stercorigallinarum]